MNNPSAHTMYKIISTNKPYINYLILYYKINGGGCTKVWNFKKFIKDKAKHENKFINDFMNSSDYFLTLKQNVPMGHTKINLWKYKFQVLLF